jgi:hypothetical protein
MSAEKNGFFPQVRSFSREDDEHRLCDFLSVMWIPVCRQATDLVDVTGNEDGKGLFGFLPSANSRNSVMSSKSCIYLLMPLRNES